MGLDVAFERERHANTAACASSCGSSGSSRTSTDSSRAEPASRCTSSEWTVPHAPRRGLLRNDLGRITALWSIHSVAALQLVSSNVYQSDLSAVSVAIHCIAILASSNHQPVAVIITSPPSPPRRTLCDSVGDTLHVVVASERTRCSTPPAHVGVSAVGDTGRLPKPAPLHSSVRSQFRRSTARLQSSSRGAVLPNSNATSDQLSLAPTSTTAPPSESEPRPCMKKRYTLRASTRSEPVQRTVPSPLGDMSLGAGQPMVGTTINLVAAP